MCSRIGQLKLEKLDSGPRRVGDCQKFGVRKHDFRSPGEEYIAYDESTGLRYVMGNIMLDSSLDKVIAWYEAHPRLAVIESKEFLLNDSYKAFYIEYDNSHTHGACLTIELPEESGITGVRPTFQISMFAYSKDYDSELFELAAETFFESLTIDIDQVY